MRKNNVRRRREEKMSQAEEMDERRGRKRDRGNVNKKREEGEL